MLPEGSYCAPNFCCTQFYLIPDPAVHTNPDSQQRPPDFSHVVFENFLKDPPHLMIYLNSLFPPSLYLQIYFRLYDLPPEGYVVHIPAANVLHMTCFACILCCTSTLHVIVLHFQANVSFLPPKFMYEGNGVGHTFTVVALACKGFALGPKYVALSSHGVLFACVGCWTRSWVVHRVTFSLVQYLYMQMQQCSTLVQHIYPYTMPSHSKYNTVMC